MKQQTEQFRTAGNFLTKVDGALSNAETLLFNTHLIKEMKICGI